MSESKHTPGPWKYEEETRTIRSEPSNHWLATMNSFDGAVNNAANANLIAAAPDLLKTLEQVAYCIDNRHGDVSQHTWNRTIESVKAAIAKATGQQ